MFKLQVMLRCITFSLLLTEPISFVWGSGKPGIHAGTRFDIQMVVWRGITDAERAFIRTVKKHGLADTVPVWNAGQNATRLQEIKQRIEAHPPQLLYLFGTTVTLIFAGSITPHQPISTTLQQIPMLFNIVADPVGSGITRDYGPTGRNLTGISHSVPLPVQARIINDLNVTNVAALFNPKERNSAATLKTLKEHLHKHKITLTQFPVLSANNLENAASTDWPLLAKKLRQANVDLVYLPSDSMIISHAQAIVTVLHSVGLPTFSATEDPINKAGALMGVISHYAAAGHHAGLIAERILRKNIPISTIPIATPTHYLFLVNETSMKQLQYYPPIPLLQFAEFVTGTPHQRHNYPLNTNKETIQ